MKAHAIDELLARAVTDASADLQAAVDAAIADGRFLDLEGVDWRFNTPIVANGDLKMRNGTLTYGGTSGTPGTPIKAFTINGTPEIENVRFHKMQSVDLVGLEISGAIEARLTRCEFTNWRNGGSVGLRLDNVQIGEFRGCKFFENDRHLETSGVVSTDCKFYSCTFREGVGTNNQSSIYLDNAQHFAFYGCTLENARKSHMIELNNCSNARFDSVRFENTGYLTPGVYSYINLTNGCDFIMVGDLCTFDNTTPDTGVYPDLVVEDGSSTYLIFRNSVFPVSSATIAVGADFQESGNKNFSTG